MIAVHAEDLPMGTPTSAPAASTEEPTSAPKVETEEVTVTPGVSTEEPTVTPEVETEEPTVTPEVSTEEPTSTPGVSTEEPTSTPEAATEEPTVTPVAPTEEPTSTPIASTEEPTSTPATSADTVSIEIPKGTTFKSAIPDDNFRKFVKEAYFSENIKDDAEFTKDMLAKLQEVTGTLNVSGKGIVNLKGIEYFTGITELDCSHNKLQLLDLSDIKGLKKLDVSYNDLVELTFSKETVLESVNCSNNNLLLLNLAGFTTVERLDCSNNKIGMLNIAGLNRLKVLDCSDNMLTALSVDGLVALEQLYCDGNAIVSMDVSALKNLKVFENRKSVLKLKVETVNVGSDSFCGVVLPKDAAKPENISNGGVYKDTVKAIVWAKSTDIPASFTYTYAVPGSDQTVTVTVYPDKSEFADKAVTLGQVPTLTVASTAYNKVKLTWGGVDGATGYRIYRSTSKTSGFTKIKSITSSSKVTYTNSGIACGTTYYYKVRAYRLIDGIYYFGAYSTVVAGKAVPAAPGALSVAKASKKKVTVSWNKVAGASGYRVYRSKSKTSGFSSFKTVKSGATVSFKKATTRKVKYYYKVRAYTTVNGKKVWGAYSAVKAKKLS